MSEQNPQSPSPPAPAAYPATAHPATAYPAAAHPAAYPPAYPPAGQPAPRSPSLLWGLLTVVAAGLVGIPVGLVAGIAVASATSAPPAVRSARPAQSPFPGDVRYLPGLTVTTVRRAATGGAWQCKIEPAMSDLDGVPLKLSCANTVTHRASLTAYYQDETHIREVQGYCLQDASNPSRCDTFFGQVAELVFTAGQKDLVPQARSWSRAHGRSDQGTTIGVVNIKASLPGVLSFAGVG